MTDLTSLSTPRRGSGVAPGSQATLVEQTRATAEVAAAVEVALRFPRDMDRSRAQMRQACSSLSLAERAFYSVPNRGHDASIHLARELARCFGNIQHGVVETSRNDAARQSEVHAYAWDVENNVRSVRSFIVPHARMKGRSRQELTDLSDIVNNNNNAGARAVRETIWHVIPRWFRDEAIGLCRQTLERGDGSALPDRIDKMLNAFRRINVTTAQLEKRLSRTQAKWDEQDVAALGVVYQSIQAGETTADDEFPADRPSPAADVLEQVRGES